MGAKKVQISPNAGTNWYTFPGDKGEKHNDATGIKDTILGQLFQSEQTGMINWTITSNGLYKGFAGYVAKILKSGTPTTFTAEATTLVSGKIYKITSTIKNVWDRTTTVVVSDGGTPIVSPATNIVSIDYLFGIVTLASGYTPSGAITFAGKYLPMTQVAKANGFTLTQTSTTVDDTVFETAQANGGYSIFDYGLRTVSLALKGIFASSNGFEALLAARSEMVIEINPDGGSKSVGRGWFKEMSVAQSGNVGELEAQDLSFTLSVPDQSDILVPFSWTFDPATTLNRAIREAILAWETGTLTMVNYLPDGATGTKGSAVVTDVTLTGGLDVMNDFAIKFQGSDAPVAYP
jgi:hypothetical protein